MSAKVIPLRPESKPVQRYEPVVPEQGLPAVACPFCESDATRPESIYGCHMMVAQYYCEACRTSFDWVRGD